MFKWDLLHLFNKAHIYRLGCVEHEVKDIYIVEDNHKECDSTVADNIMLKL